MQCGNLRMSSVMAFGGLALALCLLIAPSALAAPVSCGTVVTTDLTLENDLVGCAGDGLIVAADNVSIDLNGHTVAGRGAGRGLSVGQEPVELRPVSNVAISNGDVQGFATGIYAQGNDNLLLTELTVRDNVLGIRLDTGTRALVTRNRVIKNTGNGLLSGIPGSNVIRDNRFVGNGMNGLVAAEDSSALIEGNFASHNGASGILVNDSVSTISNNTMFGNGRYGLEVHERIASFMQHYVVADNAADQNQAGGIFFVCGPECPVPGHGDPAVPPVVLGNTAKNNGSFDCRFTAQFLSIVFVYDELTCARNRGQAKLGLAEPAAVLPHP